jgi:hypothetical protein
VPRGRCGCGGGWCVAATVQHHYCNTAASSPDADTQHQTKQPTNKRRKKFCIAESTEHDATAGATVQKGLTGTDVATDIGRWATHLTDKKNNCNGSVGHERGGRVFVQRHFDNLKQVCVLWDHGNRFFWHLSKEGREGIIEIRSVEPIASNLATQ